MKFEAIGILALAFGAFTFFFDVKYLVVSFVVFTILGAASALTFGSTSIPPGHFFILFLCVYCLSFRAYRADAIRSLVFPEAGFWLASLIVYGIAVGYIIPRIYPGTTDIFAVGTSEYEPTGTTIPLSPVSGNITQAIYLASDLVCFVLIRAVCMSNGGFEAVFKALVWYSFANIFFAFADLITSATGTGQLLEFIRNAQYTIRANEENAGLQRIIGSFTEASSFAHATLGILGFSGTLWLSGRMVISTGVVSILSLLLLIVSTSSAGLAGLVPLCALLYFHALSRSSTKQEDRESSFAVIAFPIISAAMFLIIMAVPSLNQIVFNYLDILIFSKNESQSGIERSSWNTNGIRNFLDTYGIGVGLGTTRTSSFAIALISNVGVIGTIFYLLFAFMVLSKREKSGRSLRSDVAVACRNACLSLLVGDIAAGTLVDQGLTFFVFAAVSSTGSVNVKGPVVDKPLSAI